MATRNNPFLTLRTFDNGTAPGSMETEARNLFYSLPALRDSGFPNVMRLPRSLRIVLESLLRNCDGRKVTERDIQNLAGWRPDAPGDYEVPFTVARVILQDFTGVPLLVDLAAMRAAAARLGRDPKLIEPLVPVDLVVDHSVQVDCAGEDGALEKNLAMEFRRNRERYQFLKWGMQAFETFKVVPPGVGICHQVNLEYLARGVFTQDDVCYPDTLVGTDSHTTMINGLGIVGWGVGGIEAEAAMLGQPVTFLAPEVVGVHMDGRLQPGVTATDTVLAVTEMLRKARVVGKFVEFFGLGAAALSVPDRATLANMAPEYGATMGYFGVDAKTVAYYRETGRSEAQCRRIENYYSAQGLWGIPRRVGEVDYSQVIKFDLGSVRPCVAGPRRPQDRVLLTELQGTWTKWRDATLAAAAASAPKTTAETKTTTKAKTSPAPSATLPSPSASSTSTPSATSASAPTPPQQPTTPPAAAVPVAPAEPPPLPHGSILIAAITSCTNTSNPAVMLAAGLLARNAVARGLRPPAHVKTSLGPGSRVVTEYLRRTDLQDALDELGFQTVGYGCTTCIGNSGPLPKELEDTVRRHGVLAASVLSGNRNFEARVHQSIKANFLMSPPLVIAFALAGTVDINMSTTPLGTDRDGHPVYLRNIWPDSHEIAATLRAALTPDDYHRHYTNFETNNPRWNEIPAATLPLYQWDAASTYIQEPPFFTETDSLAPRPIAPVPAARLLGLFGDSITTDHISPAGNIKQGTPAALYLDHHGVPPADYNSYGSRRGNDRVMTRGTFANIRIKNLLAPGTEGGLTTYYPPANAAPTTKGTPQSGTGGSPASPRAAANAAAVATDANAAAAVPAILPIYDAAQRYRADGTPLLVIAGEDYGMGSSRDWAAKGTALLGVRAVIAKSFERIHRSNLVGMGILPLEFANKTDYDRILAHPDATFDLLGLDDATFQPRQPATLRVHPASAAAPFDLPLRVRIDTPIEADYYRARGILPYVLSQILAAPAAATQ